MGEDFDWNKHMKVFTHEVGVKIKKNVTRQDVIFSLINEGEFIFKGEDGISAMNIESMKGKATKEQKKVFRDLVWGQIDKYMSKEKIAKKDVSCVTDVGGKE